jgi:hypothetical protein
MTGIHLTHNAQIADLPRACGPDVPFEEIVHRLLERRFSTATDTLVLSVICRRQVRDGRDVRIPSPPAIERQARINELNRASGARPLELSGLAESLVAALLKLALRGLL